MYDITGKLTLILITISYLQIKESLEVSKQAAQKCDVESFDIRS